jgi:hypothetical protein
MVSLVAVMQSGATVETATIGRAGVIGARAGLGARSTFARAIVQLPGTAGWLSASHFSCRGHPSNTYQPSRAAFDPERTWVKLKSRTATRCECRRRMQITAWIGLAHAAQNVRPMRFPIGLKIAQKLPLSRLREPRGRPGPPAGGYAARNIRSTRTLDLKASGISS